MSWTWEYVGPGKRRRVYIERARRGGRTWTRELQGAPDLERTGYLPPPADQEPE